MQLSIPLSRNTDPQTSVDAAEKAKTFKARHIALIYEALNFYRHGLIPRHIAYYTGMDYTAIQRRGAEMERKGLITRGPDVRDGMKIWRVK